MTLSPRLSGLPADVHDNVALQSFVDGISHQEIRRMFRLMNIEDLKSTSVYAFKFRAAEQNSCRECHNIRAVSAQDFDSHINKLQKNFKNHAKKLRSLKEHKLDRVHPLDIVLLLLVLECEMPS